jgi:hypothetical protein
MGHSLLHHRPLPIQVGLNDEGADYVVKGGAPRECSLRHFVYLAGASI